MAKKETKGDERLEAVESTLTKTELFIETNYKPIVYCTIAIVVLVLGYLAYQRFYIQPLEEEAQTQIFVAEGLFESDEFEKALNGDTNILGFLDIISEYGNTKTGNLARYYAGVSYMKLGQFEEAISQLEKFKSKDQMVAPMAIGLIGDAYSELNDMTKAAEYYMKAAHKTKNEFTSPFYLMRAATIYEMDNKFEKALKAYEEVKKDYPTSVEGRGIDRYIARVKHKN
jgi:tetratricopeptide (TPR) repeat protein